MAKPSHEYCYIEVESFGANGQVQIRPVPGQRYSQRLRVHGSTPLWRDYPVGTRFRVKVKLTDCQDLDYLYTSWQWPVEVLEIGRLPPADAIAAC
jgi:hypothetical protein